MLKKAILFCLAGVGFVLAAGCEPIREPWVRGPEQLRQERTRAVETDLALRHRLQAGQSDR